MSIGARFSEWELRELKRLHAMTTSDYDIADALGRSHSAVRRRRERLGLSLNRQIRPASGKFRKRAVNFEKRYETVHGNGARPDKATLALRLAERDRILELPRSTDTEILGDPIPGSGRSALERRAP